MDFQLFFQPIARPAAKVGGVRMIKPYSVSRKQKFAVRFEQAMTFVQIPIQIPDMFENLKRDNRIGQMILERNGRSRSDFSFHFAVQIAANIAMAGCLEKWGVGRFTCANIYDCAVAQTA